MDGEQIYAAATHFIDGARGTCMSEDAVFEMFEIPYEFRDNIEFWCIVENSIFLCTQCGWWMESHEHSIHETDEFICTECWPDEDE